MSTVIVLKQNTMGNGDDILGEKLIGAFLKKLWIKKEKPETIVLYNAGVKLVSNESPYLDALSGLEEAGVEIIACGTCLDFFNIEGELKVGRRSDMVEIVDTMMSADKTITI